MGIREAIHDELYTTFYFRIIIYGYGRTMETRSVERLEPMEISLIKPIMRLTATTTHQIRSSGYHLGLNHYGTLGCYRTTEISVCFVTVGVNGM